ncbi:uncharacterized protein FN964_000453 isoform 1-T2 [Alca torda]
MAAATWSPLPPRAGLSRPRQVGAGAEPRRLPPARPGPRRAQCRAGSGRGQRLGGHPLPGRGAARACRALRASPETPGTGDPRPPGRPGPLPRPRRQWSQHHGPSPRLPAPPRRHTPPPRPGGAVLRALPGGTGRRRARGRGARGSGRAGTGAVEAKPGGGCGGGRGGRWGPGRAVRLVLPRPPPGAGTGPLTSRAAAAEEAGGRRRHPAGPEGVKRKGRVGPSHSLAGRFVSGRRRRRGAEQAAPARPPRGAVRRRRARGGGAVPRTTRNMSSGPRPAKWLPPGAAMSRGGGADLRPHPDLGGGGRGSWLSCCAVPAVGPGFSQKMFWWIYGSI